MKHTQKQKQATTNATAATVVKVLRERTEDHNESRRAIQAELDSKRTALGELNKSLQWKLTAY